MTAGYRHGGHKIRAHTVKGFGPHVATVSEELRYKEVVAAIRRQIGIGLRDGVEQCGIFEIPSHIDRARAIYSDTIDVIAQLARPQIIAGGIEFQHETVIGVAAHIYIGPTDRHDLCFRLQPASDAIDRLRPHGRPVTVDPHQEGAAMRVIYRFIFIACYTTDEIGIAAHIARGIYVT